MSIPLTVALLTYNRASTYLKAAIQGILNQTYRDFEFLILDNGSTDDTPSVVLGINDERIRYVRNPPGLSAEFNGASAFMIARGERLVITHDDDIMEPEMLARQMAMLDRNPKIMAVWANISIIDQDGSLVQERLTPPGKDRIFKRGKYIASYAETRLWPCPSALMIVKYQLDKMWAELYSGDEEMEKEIAAVVGSGDVLTPAKLNVMGSVAFLDEPLLKYRRHTVQESKQRLGLSLGVLYEYKALWRMVGRTPYGPRYQPVFASYIARYMAQHEIIYVQEPALPQKIVAKARALFGKALVNVWSNCEAAYPLLPLIILLAQAGKEGGVAEVLATIKAPSRKHQRSVHALFAWARKRKSGKNLFASLPRESSVVILGSAFVAVLLINEARERGLNILCCLDSNVTRQGGILLGVPIVPPAWLAAGKEKTDLIVFSSELDHEVQLQALVRHHDKTTPTLSWKDFAVSSDK